MLPTSPTLFLDFDGTITTRDATDAILDAYADPAWLDVEDAWKAGRIGSRACLSTQMALVRARRDQVDALLDGIEIDAGFLPLLALCVSRHVPVHIVSDGFDYCIRRILGRPSLGLQPYLAGTRIVSSHLETDGHSWRATFTESASACTHGCATCKPAAMDELKGGGPTLFVGDGLSDRYAAAAASVVFAKDDLAAYCCNESIPYTPFHTLTTVADELERLLAPAASVSSAFSGKALPTT